MPSNDPLARLLGLHRPPSITIPDYARHPRTRPPRRPRPADANAFTLEPLEARMLLSADMVGDTLVVTGTEGNDVIRIYAGRRPGQIVVKDFSQRGRPTCQIFTGVNAIDVQTLGGADRVDIGWNLRDTGRAVIGVVVDTGAGNDRVHGGSGDDRITTGDGDDVVIDKRGDNVVDTGAGDDRVCLGFGDDTVNTGDGNDRVNDCGGTNTVTLGAGDDRYVGGFGVDLVDGGAGRDRLIGGFGDDYLIGGADDDVLFGGWGADTLDIAQGNDRIVWPDSRDTIIDTHQPPPPPPDEPGDGDDHGDTLETATMIQFDTLNDASIQGNIDTADDTDLFSFEAPLSGSVFVTPAIGTSAAVTLLDAAGQVLTTFGSFFLSYPIAAGETYFLRVTGAAGAAYEVFLSARP